MNKPTICMIAAMDKNRGIGIQNRIPWDIPEDMNYLREVTKGRPLIMGRATYESICAIRGIDGQVERAMPGRLNIVVTRSENYFPNGAPEGVMMANTPAQGLNLAYDFAVQAGIDKIFIFGGGEIYKALLGRTESLYLTEIDNAFNCDAYFPEFSSDEWMCESRESKDNGEYQFAFNVYNRLGL